MIMPKVDAYTVWMNFCIAWPVSCSNNIYDWDSWNPVSIKLSQHNDYWAVVLFSTPTWWSSKCRSCLLIKCNVLKSAKQLSALPNKLHFTGFGIKFDRNSISGLCLELIWPNDSSGDLIFTTANRASMNEQNILARITKSKAHKSNNALKQLYLLALVED